MRQDEISRLIQSLQFPNAGIGWRLQHVFVGSVLSADTKNFLLFFLDREVSGPTRIDWTDKIESIWLEHFYL